MSITQMHYQEEALKNVLATGKYKNKHAVLGKIRQLQQRIRQQERHDNFKNWLAQ